MKSTGRYCEILASESERLDKEMEDEIYTQRQHIFKLASNLNSLLGKQRAKEVYKSIINTLIEQL